MNFLAHHQLAGTVPDRQLGSWLGDFLRGRAALRAWPEAVVEGILQHRAMDNWLDHLPEVQTLRAQFPRPYRRYAGIILDMLLDHFLARSWQRYDARSLEETEQEAYGLLRSHWENLPERLQRFVEYAESRSLLSAYRDMQTVRNSLAGIGQRLKRDNPLGDVEPLIPLVYAGTEQLFHLVYPRAQAFARGWVQGRRSTITGS